MRPTTPFGLVVLTVSVAGCNPSASTSPNGKSKPAATAATIAVTEKSSVAATTASKAEEAEGPVEFKLTVDELSKELKRGGRTAKAKYAGKRVELSGKVLSLHASGSLSFAMFGNLEDDLPTTIVLRPAYQ